MVGGGIVFGLPIGALVSTTGAATFCLLGDGGCPTAAFFFVCSTFLSGPVNCSSHPGFVAFFFGAAFFGEAAL